MNLCQNVPAWHSIYICVCVHVCICICMHVCNIHYVYMCIYIHVIHTCMCMHTNAYIYRHAYICIYMYMLHVCLRFSIRLSACSLSVSLSVYKPSQPQPMHPPHGQVCLSITGILFPIVYTAQPSQPQPAQPIGQSVCLFVCLCPASLSDSFEMHRKVPCSQST